MAGLTLLAASTMVSTYGSILRAPWAMAAPLTCTVNSSGDSGTGSLRNCMTLIQGNSDGGTIDFDVTSVTLTSALPPIMKDTTITGGSGDDSVTITAGISNFRFLTVGANGLDVALDHLTITGFDIDALAAGADRGAVLFVGSASGNTIAISACVISGNTGNNVIDANGGATTLSITDTTFEDNTATANGYAYGVVDFRNSGPLTVTDSTFSNNSASGGGGAIFDYGTHVTTITGSTFSGNSSPSGSGAGHRGGAVYSSGATLVISDDTFSGNSADGYGGAIFVYGGSLEISNSRFSDNSAQGYGGAVHQYNKGSVTAPLEITGSTFSRNYVDGVGGAVSHSSDDPLRARTWDITDSTFSDDSASSKGGAVYTWEGDVMISDSTFSGHSASWGGAIMNNGGSTTATRSSFYNNSAEASGAIAVGSGGVTLVNSFVGHNHSTDNIVAPTNPNRTGGVYSGGDVHLQFSTVYGNSVAGGAPSQIAAMGTLHSTASIIADDTVLVGSGPVFSASAADFSSTVLTGASAYPSPVPIPSLSPGSGFQVGPGQVGLETLPPSPSASPGQLGQAPLPTSVAYTAAPTANPLPSASPAITADQVGAPRPNPTTSAWTIGSRQFAASASPSPSPSPTVTPSPTPAPAPVPSMAPGAQVLSGHVGVPLNPTSTFTLANFTLPPRYSVYPALPAGLTLDPATGVVSGTPTAAHPSTRHWITATAGGGAESASSTLQVQVAAGPQPQPVPPLPPGSAGLMVDGQPAAGLTVAPNAGEDGLNLTGPGFTMRLAGLDPEGSPVPLGGDAVLQVIPGANTTTGGGGFAPGSQVGIFLDPAASASSVVVDLVRQALGVPRAAEAITLGRLAVAADGTFAGSLPLPDGLAVGAHVLQAVGYSPSGQSRTISVGIRAIEDTTPSILITGTRTGNRVTVNGATEGLTSPTVVPHYRFAGQDRYRTGLGRPTIDATGDFTWSRKAGRTIYLYFTADGTKSNRLILRRDT